MRHCGQSILILELFLNFGKKKAMISAGQKCRDPLLPILIVINKEHSSGLTVRFFYCDHLPFLTGFKVSDMNTLVDSLSLIYNPLIVYL